LLGQFCHFREYPKWSSQSRAILFEWTAIFSSEGERAFLDRPLVLFAVNLTDNFIDNLREKLGDKFEFAKSSSKEEAMNLAKKAQVLVMIAPNKDIISAAANCKWLHALTAGVEDYLAVPQIHDNPSIVLTNSSGIHAVPVSEHVFALLLALTRNIKNIILDQERKRWPSARLGSRQVEIEELFGKTMTIFGIGSIGLEIAKKAKSFGMSTLGIRRSIGKEVKNPSLRDMVDEIFSVGDSDLALSRSDVVVDTLPVTTETQGYFNSERFSKFKTSSIFINIGRGATVLEDALIQAIKLGRISGAALDVFELEPLPENSELWSLPNVIVSPHIAGWTPNYYEKASDIVEDNLRRYSEGKILRNVVDKVAGY
jgi:phosphoglycerate dehydrogenase-like enzyme